MTKHSKEQPEQLKLLEEQLHLKSAAIDSANAELVGKREERIAFESATEDQIQLVFKDQLEAKTKRLGVELVNAKQTLVCETVLSCFTGRSGCS